MKLRIGTRESKLAVIQAKLIAESIHQSDPELIIELVMMKTTGDKILDRTLDKIGGKGLFVKELDLALKDRVTDISVHSLKDMPMQEDVGLPIIACSKREDPRDVLILKEGCSERDTDLPIGCSSLRRVIQAEKLYPGAVFKPIRGNVITRLKKLENNEYGALILAAAGLTRLGLKHRIHRYFEVDEIIPAAGQGILAVQGRAGEVYSWQKTVNDEDSLYAAICERAFVRFLNGGCSSPMAAYAVVEGERIDLTALYYRESDGKMIKGHLEGLKTEAAAIGDALAEKLSGSD